MKILNLNKIAPQSTHRIVLNDVSHAILPMTVENFVLTTAKVEELNQNNASYAEQVESTVDMILRSIPTLTRDELMDRSLDELNTVAAFVRGEDVDGQEVVEGK